MKSLDSTAADLRSFTLFVMAQLKAGYVLGLVVLGRLHRALAWLHRFINGKSLWTKSGTSWICEMRHRAGFRINASMKVNADYPTEVLGRFAAEPGDNGMPVGRDSYFFPVVSEEERYQHLLEQGETDRLARIRARREIFQDAVYAANYGRTWVSYELSVSVSKGDLKLISYFESNLTANPTTFFMDDHISRIIENALPSLISDARIEMKRIERKFPAILVGIMKS